MVEDAVRHTPQNALPAAGLFFISALPAAAERLDIAVAANMARPAEAIASAFAAESGHDVRISLGSSGALFTQITQGAPFDVFLAADTSRPERLAAEGHAVPGTEFVYAIGRLVLYGAARDLEAGAEALSDESLRHLAIADPLSAPYGAAALETMQALGLYDRLQGRLVTGSSVTQAFQFTETGNAELGFIALSQVQDRPKGRIWVVPDHLYTPIAQGAVQTRAGADNPAAAEFLAFLKGQVARDTLAAAGYGLPPGPPPP